VNPPSRSRVRIGECVVDLERQLLLDAHGDLVPLRPRAWRVLCLLAERQGRVVGKEELMSVVWADRVVTDDSLVQAVADIRRALDEAGARALRTVPRRGYLLASERPDAPPQEPADPERRTEPGSRGSRPVGSLGERLRARPSWRRCGRPWAGRCRLTPFTSSMVPAESGSRRCSSD
jgi:DNA-binding winged helix-turn-helix (wHTH) protein